MAPTEMSTIRWRVFCEFCPDKQENLETRREAVTWGHNHVEAKHADDEEYAFRVQGVRQNAVEDLSEVGRKPRRTTLRLDIDRVRDMIPAEPFTIRDFARILGSSSAAQHWLEECLGFEYVEQTEKLSAVDGPSTPLYRKTAYLKELQAYEASLR